MRDSSVVISAKTAHLDSVLERGADAISLELSLNQLRHVRDEFTNRPADNSDLTQSLQCAFHSCWQSLACPVNPTLHLHRALLQGCGCRFMSCDVRHPTCRSHWENKRAIVPQHTQVITNVARKAFSALSPINKQFIEIGTQGARVRPHCGDEIGDARVEFAERARLDSRRQSVEPFLCVRQED